MIVSVIQGTLRFELIVVDPSKLGLIEGALTSVTPDQIFDFLPPGIIVKEFGVDTESQEAQISVSTPPA
jgi:hypothetical protein